MAKEIDSIKASLEQTRAESERHYEALRNSIDDLRYRIGSPATSSRVHGFSPDLGN